VVIDEDLPRLEHGRSHTPKGGELAIPDRDAVRGRASAGGR
jgi:hypothetical protein